MELRQGFMKVAVSGAVGLRECLDSLHCISKQKNEQIIMVARITRACMYKNNIAKVLKRDFIIILSQVT